MQYIILNNQLINADEAKISPQDRGFRYGDGVFETMLVQDRRIYQWDFHVDRLARGLAAIKISFDVSFLIIPCFELVSINGVKNGLLRLQITRGIGGRGYLPDASATPTLVIETMEMPAPPPLAISLWLSSYSKISPKSLPVNFKLCQGLNSTLARMEAAENNCFDALMLNEAGAVCETSSANIFWLKNGVLYTPALACGVLEGGMRNAVLRLSPYPVQEVEEGVESLRSAEEVFITNTAYKILPVSELKPLNLIFDSYAVANDIANKIGREVDKRKKITKNKNRKK